MSNDNPMEYVGRTSSNESDASSQSKRKSGAQKSKPRKRKLRPIGEEYDEEEVEEEVDDRSRKSASRSRCF